MSLSTWEIAPQLSKTKKFLSISSRFKKKLLSLLLCWCLRFFCRMSVCFDLKIVQSLQKSKHLIGYIHLLLSIQFLWTFPSLKLSVLRPFLHSNIKKSCHFTNNLPCGSKPKWLGESNLFLGKNYENWMRMKFTSRYVQWNRFFIDEGQSSHKKQQKNLDMWIFFTWELIYSTRQKRWK